MSKYWLNRTEKVEFVFLVNLYLNILMVQGNDLEKMKQSIANSIDLVQE